MRDIKLGDARTKLPAVVDAVRLLIPLKAADPDRLAAALARAEALAKGRDVAAEDAALAAFGDVDPVDWSVAAVKALTGTSKA